MTSRPIGANGRGFSCGPLRLEIEKVLCDSLEFFQGEVPFRDPFPELLPAVVNLLQTDPELK